MSRVHDALRKAAQENPQAERVNPTRSARYPIGQTFDPNPDQPHPAGASGGVTAAVADAPGPLLNTEECIQNARRVEYRPLSDALLVNPSKPRQAPAEEFRTLRTRLNHLQSIQPLRTLVVTSASPAEGKSFTAANLALTQAQLADKRVLLADFDFRRPTVDKTFQIPVSPGMTNYLRGAATLADIMIRVGDSNLYVLTAGDAVPNPLELLNLKECGALIEELRAHFDWVILDSPPLLFAADGNLLATMSDGTILVVRIGTTTFDSVSRALQSLCENNVLGIVVNGARRGELYSKYSYYHDYYDYGADVEGADARVQGHDHEEPDPALAD
ncbi:MAG TPA: CpsD/CapB family tyrosine-protein kinase [Bryobacteraceae bacterium]|jgi:receptor protein-tyrosine kinase